MKEGNLSRRLFILGGLSTVATGTTGIRELATNIELKLGRYAVQTVSHNASDSPRKFERAIASGSHFVELDVTVVNNLAVAAHDTNSYLKRPDDDNRSLRPKLLLEKIVEAKKLPMLDLKDEVIDMRQIAQTLQITELPADSIVSSKNHALLKELRENGFQGTLLFTIDSPSKLENFFTINQDADFSEEKYNYGVSIRHTLLWGSDGRKAAKRLRSLGLSIAAWTPNTDSEIHTALNRANIIISDNYGAFKA